MPSIRLPILLAAALWLLAALPGEAEAMSPPPMPLPECIFVAGQPAGGACPALSDWVDATAGGALTPGTPTLITTVPALAVCDGYNAYTWIWTPSPCYSAVAAPQILGCAAIDLDKDNAFREVDCYTALYKSRVGLPNPLFTMARPAGEEDYYVGSRCGATPSYEIYGYGGPSSIEASVWRSRGPKSLKCNVTLAGPRPDALIGPTWVKMRVTVNRGVTGSRSPGAAHFADIYVPIDGDLKDKSDVSISATGEVTRADWDAGVILATYHVMLTNDSQTEALDVETTSALPRLVAFMSASNPGCTSQYSNAPDTARLLMGGNVVCRLGSIPAQQTVTFDIQVRIANTTDLSSLEEGEYLQNFANDPTGMKTVVKSPNDANAGNNTTIAKTNISFRGGSYNDTLAAMEALAPYFNYTTNSLFKTCNVYKDDIFARLMQIRREHPEVFTHLSFGPITSGRYNAGGFDAGHVGVVVYLKGTHYRRAGIIINGTPSPSPLQAVSQIGPTGYDATILGWTAENGYYLRTPANKFPGKPQQEANDEASAFEGTYGVATPVAAPPDQTCPYAPQALNIQTQSPVELLITNSKGQRVETQDGEIIRQELESGIHSMAFPHEDGTFAWSITLPLDRYDVKLTGTRTGTYRLIRTTFAADGKPIDEITDGSTTPGHVESFTLVAPEAPPAGGGGGSGGGTGGGTGSSSGGGSSGGGGALDLSGILALLATLAWRRRLIPRQ